MASYPLPRYIFALGQKKAANEAVRESVLTLTSKSRRAYVKYTLAQQTMVGEYASIHGNLVAVGQ